MVFETTMTRLEERIDEIIRAYEASKDKVTSLESRVAELEQQATASADAAEQITALEQQRDELVARLEKVLATIDKTLDSAS